MGADRYGIDDMDVLDMGAFDRLGGLEDPEAVALALELIGLFEDSSRDQRQQIEAGTTRGSWQDVLMAAHTLKSSAGYVGAGRVSRLATLLEQSARDGQIAEATALAALLGPALDEASAQLAALRVRLA